VGSAGEGPLLVTKQLAFEQGFGHPGAVDGDERPFLAQAGFMDGMGDQFLAGTGFTKQDDGGIGRRHAQHLFQHANEGRRPADQALRRGPAARLADDAHGLDEIGDLPAIVADRRRLDIHMLVAARRVVQMQHALWLPGFQALLQRAGFTRLIAGHRKMMRYLVAAAPDDLPAAAELADIGGIGSDDPVLGIHHDSWLGQAIEEGKQFAEKMRSHVGIVKTVTAICQ